MTGAGGEQEEQRLVSKRQRAHGAQRERHPKCEIQRVLKIIKHATATERATNKFEYEIHMDEGDTTADPLHRQCANRVYAADQ